MFKSDSTLQQGKPGLSVENYKTTWLPHCICQCVRFILNNITKNKVYQKKDVRCIYTDIRTFGYYVSLRNLHARNSEKRHEKMRPNFGVYRWYVHTPAAYTCCNFMCKCISFHYQLYFSWIYLLPVNFDLSHIFMCHSRLRRTHNP